MASSMLITYMLSSKKDLMEDPERYPLCGVVSVKNTSMYCSLVH
jgi:hypothetical protein